MRHGHVEASASGFDDSMLEPVRRAGRVSGDDDRVGGEAPERILERLQRISVADLAAHVETGASQSIEGCPQALGSGFASTVFVGGPRADSRVERRADDEDILGNPSGHPHDLVA